VTSTYKQENNNMKYWILLIFFIISCARKESMPIRFLNEEIKMSIDSGRVAVTGTYYFKNITNQNKTAKIFYPFPIDDFHYYPDFILVSGFDYTENDSGISFIMKFKPMAMESLAIFYEQRLNNNQARYILKTTQQWQNPLQEARFIINLPENFTAIHLSYPSDSTINKDNRIYYYINKKNFMPKEDLIVTWQYEPVPY